MEDLGMSNWRIGVLYDYDKKDYSLIIENFDVGFIDGEQFDKLFIPFHQRRFQYGLDFRVSIITKYKSKINEYKTLVLDTFPKVVEDIICAQEEIIKSEQKKLRRFEKIRNCNVMKMINREKDINKLLEEDGK